MLALFGFPSRPSFVIPCPSIEHGQRGIYLSLAGAHTSVSGHHSLAGPRDGMNQQMIMIIIIIVRGGTLVAHTPAGPWGNPLTKEKVCQASEPSRTPSWNPLTLSNTLTALMFLPSFAVSSLSLSNPYASFFPCLHISFPPWSFSMVFVLLLSC